MDPEFWHERWEKDEIGFHQPEVNPHLRKFIDRLGAKAGAAILVPLCGKSLDMLWLSQEGFSVFGIEISEVAARDFFVENGLDYERVVRGGRLFYRHDRITICCADFFALDAQEVPAVDAVYDRASLIALPPDMRPAYAEHLAGLITGGTPSLLVTLEYPQEEMRGPPFSVRSGEVEQLFGSHFLIEHLDGIDCLEREPRFRKKGLSRLEEQVFLLNRIR